MAHGIPEPIRQAFGEMAQAVGDLAFAASLLEALRLSAAAGNPRLLEEAAKEAPQRGRPSSRYAEIDQDAARVGRIPPGVAARLGKISAEFGAEVLLEVIATAAGSYMQQGARWAALQRDGDASIECIRCRERDASTRRMMETHQRCARPLPQGSASTTYEE